MGSAHILTVITEHDGEALRGIPHRSFLVRLGKESIFIAGDAVLCEQQAEDPAGFYGSAVSAAFMNIYQIVSPDGQAFLRRLKPNRIFLYHLPFEEDDRYGYHLLVKQLLHQFPSGLPESELPAHMNWIDGEAV